MIKGSPLTARCPFAGDDWEVTLELHEGEHAVAGTLQVRKTGLVPREKNSTARVLARTQLILNPPMSLY